MLGQANHFLITILVGLNGVEQKELTKTEEFRTSWNPHNPTNSARRAREFAIKSALAWAIDSLDAYMIIANRKPLLFQQDSFKKSFDGADRSIGEKVALINRFVKPFEDIETDVEVQELWQIYSAVVEVAIVWRNRIVHSFADNILSEDTLEFFNSKHDVIKTKFNGIDVNLMLKSFEERRTPTFKECAWMILSTHRYIEIIDEYFIKKINLERYFDSIFEKYINNNQGEKKVSRIKQLDNIWSQDLMRKTKTLLRILQQKGVALTNSKPIVPFLDSTYIERLANLTFEEAKARF